ncbi:MAG: RidA family protein [Chloroflexota bacterium]
MGQPLVFLSTRVYVTDMARHRPMVNEAFERAFGANLQARTIVEVRALNQADSVEIEAVAVRRKCATAWKGELDGPRG